MAQRRYPGIKPFSQEEQSLFFGRDRDINQLTRLISLERLIVLFGKSGLGKTSLLKAGILPKLRWESSFLCKEIRFGNYNGPSHDSFNLITPYERLVEALELQQANQKPIELLSRIGQGNSVWLLAKHLQINASEEKARIFILDQFEELFSWPKIEIDRFGKALRDLMSSNVPKEISQKLDTILSETDEDWPEEILNAIYTPCNIKILISIRSDRLSMLNYFSDEVSDILKNRYELVPLDREQAWEALVLPSQQEGDFLSSTFSYSKEAQSYILDYLSQKGNHKIEAFQLQVLCQQIEDLIISSSKYRVEKSDLADLGQLFESYYDRQINKIKDVGQQRLARIFIEEELIFEEEEQRISIYSGQLFAKYSIDPETVDFLIDTHLIRAEPTNTNGVAYELSHDTLVAPVLASKMKRLQQQELSAKEQEVNDTWKRKQKFWMKAALVIAFTIGLVSVITFGAIQLINSKNRNDALKILNFSQEFAEKDPTVALKVGLMASEIYPDPIIDQTLYGIYSHNYFHKTLFQTEGQVGGGAISEDGNYIAVFGRGKDLVEAVDQSQAVVLSPNGDTLYTVRSRYRLESLTFLAETNYLAVGDGLGEVTIWNTVGDKVASIAPENRNEGSFFSKNRVEAIAGDRTGKLIAFTYSGKVFLWDWEQDSILSIYVHPDKVYSLAFCPSDSLLALGAWNGEVWLSPYSMKEHFGVPVSDQHKGKVTSLDFSPDGHTLVSGSSDNTLTIWNREGNSLNDRMRLFGHSKEVMSVKFSPEGNFILSTSLDGTAKLWSLSGRIYRVLLGHKHSDPKRDGVRVGFISRDWKYCYTGGKDGTLKQWPLFDGLHGELHSSIAWDQALTLSTGEICLLNVKGELARYNSNLSEEKFRFRKIQAVCLTSDSSGKRIWLGGQQGNIALVDDKGHQLRSWKAAETTIRNVCWVEHSRLLITTAGGILTEWNENGQIVRSWNTKQEAIYALSIDFNTERIFTGGKSGIIKVWDLDGTLRDSLVGHSSAVTTLSVGHNNKILVSGSEDRTARIWSLNKKGGELLSLLRFEASITGSAISKDEEIIAMGAKSHEVKLITSQGTTIREYTGIGNPGVDKLSLAFHKNDSHLVVAGGSVVCYRLPPTLHDFSTWYPLDNLPADVLISIDRLTQ